jgi:hypothetical protein
MLNTERLTILLPKDLKEKLKKGARKKAVALSTLIRFIAKEWIDKNDRKI